MAESSISSVYLSIDGPKDSKDLEIQNSIEKWAREYSLEKNIDFYCLRHDQNLGVGAAIIESLDWFYSEVPFGAVFEDDLEISIDFLDFVEFCRRNFESLQDLWMISGDQFFPSTSKPNQISVSNYPLVWGWATWSDRWTEMRICLLRTKPFSPFFLFSPAKSFWWAGSKRTLSGLVDTWDIPLAFEMMRLKKLTFSPPVNLVRNIGFDDVATHTSQNQFPLNLSIEKGKINFSNLFLLHSKLDIQRTNRTLEVHVFKIRLRHVLSPVKFFLSASRKSSRNSLVSRIRMINS